MTTRRNAGFVRYDLETGQRIDTPQAPSLAGLATLMLVALEAQQAVVDHVANCSWCQDDEDCPNKGMQLVALAARLRTEALAKAKETR